MRHADTLQFLVGVMWDSLYITMWSCCPYLMSQQNGCYLFKLFWEARVNNNWKAVQVWRTSTCGEKNPQTCLILWVSHGFQNRLHAFESRNCVLKAYGFLSYSPVNCFVTWAQVFYSLINEEISQFLVEFNQQEFLQVSLLHCYSNVLYLLPLWDKMSEKVPHTCT